MKTLTVALAALSVFAQAPATPAGAAPSAEDGVYARISIVQGGVPVGDIVFKLFEKEAPLLRRTSLAWPTAPNSGPILRPASACGVSSMMASRFIA